MRLPLGIDQQGPPLGSVHNDGVINRKRIHRQAVNGPILDFNRNAQNVDQTVTARAGNLQIIAQLFPFMDNCGPETVELNVNSAPIAVILIS